jgi:hypothetical protein
LDDLERMRRENEQHLKRLEQQYVKKMENSGIGREIRKRMGYDSKTMTEESDDAQLDREDEHE